MKIPNEVGVGENLPLAIIATYRPTFAALVSKIRVAFIPKLLIRLHFLAAADFQNLGSGHD
jgi:hypothetical protein